MNGPRLVDLPGLQAQGLLPQVEAIYRQSFEADEIVPFEWLVGACQKQPGRFRYRMGGLVDGDKLSGMIFYGYARELNFGYLGYLAIDPQRRGEGYGRWMVSQTFELLRETARAERSQEPRLTFWEVRDPRDAPTPKEKGVRLRRIHFYEQLGGQTLPVDYTCPPVAKDQPEVSYCLMARSYPPEGPVGFLPKGPVGSRELLLEVALAGLIDVNYAEPDSHYVIKAKESIEALYQGIP